MASYKQVFGSYIKAEDLGGKPVRVSVERVELETIKGGDGKEERKLVAHFAGKDKALVLNRTNADSLAEIFETENYDEWMGLVVLYPDTTTFGGKKVACVRIKKTAGGAAPRMPEPTPEPEPEELDSNDVPF